MKNWLENTKAGVITWMVMGVLIALFGVSWIVTAIADGEILGIVLGGLLIFAGGRSVVQARAAMAGLGPSSSDGHD